MAKSCLGPCPEATQRESDDICGTVGTTCIKGLYNLITRTVGCGPSTAAGGGRVGVVCAMDDVWVAVMAKELVCALVVRSPVGRLPCTCNRYLHVLEARDRLELKDIY